MAGLFQGEFFQWTPEDTPGKVISIDRDPDWGHIVEQYSDSRNPPLNRIVEICKGHKVRSVVIEYRYIDLDYRSEHSRFYSTTFRRYPSVCHRLHFFKGSVTGDINSIRKAADSYIGYSVMRPLPNSPVGRTVILPPNELDGGAVCWGTDEVHLWGHTLLARGMPFISQDAQYLRCAHSALWMTMYHATLRHKMPRRLSSDIQEAATGGHVIGRQLPSDGLSVGQMLAALHRLRMSGGPIRLPQDRATSRNDHRLSLPGIACRYINSQLPPIVYSDTHAWVLVGYTFDNDGLEQGDRSAVHDAIRLYRHDDARGPYLPVDDPWNEAEPAHTPWKSAVPPLPQKMYMTGERAESVGDWWLRGLVRSSSGGAIEEIKGDLTVRTYGIGNTEFLQGLEGRVEPDLENFYRTLFLPRWIWVVELMHRPSLHKGDPCVAGEAIIDATASSLATVDDPVVISRRVWNVARAVTPDHGIRRVFHLAKPRLFESGCEGIRGWRP